MSDEPSAGDPLAGLSPEARRAVLESALPAASGHLRDLLAAAARDERAAVARLATALSSDLSALDLGEVRAAAGSLAAAAEGPGPLGGSVLALSRAWEAALARLRSGGGPAAHA